MRDDDSSTETAIALLFAACVLAALLLLTGCVDREAVACDSRPPAGTPR